MVEKITPLLILVVEDDLLVRCCIAGWPRQGGHIVIEAATGEEALTLLRAQDDEPISALFTDIQLGGRLKSSSPLEPRAVAVSSAPLLVPEVPEVSVVTP